VPDRPSCDVPVDDLGREQGGLATVGGAGSCRRGHCRLRTPRRTGARGGRHPSRLFQFCFAHQPVHEPLRNRDGVAGAVVDLVGEQHARGTPEQSELPFCRLAFEADEHGIRFVAGELLRFGHGGNSRTEYRYPQPLVCGERLARCWVSFHEDDSRTRAGHAAAGLGLLRRVAVSVLNRTKIKGSRQTRRKEAGQDDDYLQHVLQGLMTE
jgi:hypothetical protein